MDNDKVINILSKKEITDYKEAKSITSNKDKLNQLVYTLELENDHYLLKSVNTIKSEKGN